MSRRSLVVAVALCVLGLTPGYATAQIVTGPDGSGPNRLGNAVSQSQDMSNPRDLFVSSDLEVGDTLYLSGVIYLEGDATSPPDGDQRIFFADASDRQNEAISWDDNADSFLMSDSLAITGDLRGKVLVFQIDTLGNKMHFLIDADATTDARTNPHLFTWYNDDTQAGSRVMELRSTGPSPELGNLTIAGSLTQSGFDLAEMFLAATAAEPGELVAVDESRPDAVRAAVAGDGGRILGIVATEPGVVLGGAAFSVEALRRQWGDDLADEFESARPALEAQIYLENAALRDEAATLVSEGAFQSTWERRMVEARPTPGLTKDDESEPETLAPPRSSLDESDVREAYTDALVEHETRLFDEILARFFEQRFARVALAGRVPVKVDASFGAIEPGDPLTASPIPGVAMKARDAGWIVGTALEARRSGSGTILAFVDRNWFGGDRRDRLAELETELETLKSALAALDLPRLELRASLASRSRVGGGR